MNNSESFKSMYSDHCSTALESSNLVCENGTMHFWLKASVVLDGYRSIETFVYNMKIDEGIIRMYRKGGSLEHLDKETIDLNELRAFTK